MHNSSDCPEPYLFESKDVFSTITHLLSIIVIPSSIYGLYLIYFKTPAHMQNLKWVLFNLHLLVMISDLMIGTLTVPYVYFPAVAGYPLGLLAETGINPHLQVFIAINCLCVVGAAITITFENRQYHLVRTSKLKIKNKGVRRLIVVINYIYPSIFQVPAFWDLPDQAEAREVLFRAIPCITRDFHNLPVITVSNTNYCVFFMTFSVVFYGVQSIFYMSNAIHYLYSGNKKSNISAKTRQMERKYYIGVCIQILIPFSVVAIPVFYFSYSILAFHYNQVLNNLGLLCFSTHGFFGTLGLIFTNKNYRSYTHNLKTLKRRRASGTSELNGTAGSKSVLNRFFRNV